MVGRLVRCWGLIDPSAPADLAGGVWPKERVGTPPTVLAPTRSTVLSCVVLLRSRRQSRMEKHFVARYRARPSHLLPMLHQLSGSTIDGASCTVDSLGNRTTKTDQWASVTTNYGYDSIYQLLQATQGGNVGELQLRSGWQPTEFAGSIDRRTPTTLTSTSNANSTYDFNNNMTSKTVSAGTTNYAWDCENRMTSVTLSSSGGTVSFKYRNCGVERPRLEQGGLRILDWVFCWCPTKSDPAHSVNSSKAALPPNRPQPLSFTPPNGICGSS
jgi:hypothetical protein